MGRGDRGSWALRTFVARLSHPVVVQRPDGDEDLFRWQYPPADMTAGEFEAFVVAQFQQTQPYVEDLRVKLHDVVQGADGSYDFDATVRFSLAGMALLVVVEAKRHKNPIKRDVVQTLQSKIQSVGAHKGVVVSTAPFQKGALDFALAHGIALVKVTEGRFTYETKSASPPAVLSREDASLYFGLPIFVGHCYSKGSKADSVACTVVTEQPDYAARLLLGVERAVDAGALHP